ncbi:MAG: ABC transporter permease subunit, partial [bacterium]|nr:ABC transporter permease subunit [bacterium]
SRPLESASLLPGEGDYRVLGFHPGNLTLLLSNGKGEVSLAHLIFEPSFHGDSREIQHRIEASPWLPLGPTEPSGPSLLWSQLSYGVSEESHWIAGLTSGKVFAAPLIQEETLMGEGELQIGESIDLSEQIEGTPSEVKINESGDILLVSTQKGEIYYFELNEAGPSLRQKFQPFSGAKDRQIASMDFLLGGVSIYLTQANGNNVLFSLFIPEGKDQRVFGKIKSFPKLPEGAQSFSPSLRNKAFLVGSGKEASLRYATTESIRWKTQLPGEILKTALSKKYHRLALLQEPDQLLLFNLKDPHPEGGLKAFFGKVWYEGANKPDYVWQSTGGSDSFEPKLSLVPLIVGTFKGTFYALLFAVPLALLAAIYTSQFLDPNLRKIIKPVMEIMASLPTVILGFLAALWLAPRIEGAIPSLILMILILPLGTIAFGLLWRQLPKGLRRWIPEGREWVVLIPFLALTAYLAWSLGPVLEALVFNYTDPETGQKIADFRLWWNSVTGSNFEQRNSLVVGVIMGFAVIPIIFTISEDSLSAVPPSLRAASLALGASRWQTAFRVILPAATAGIFSAVMIGFGRAVGETMIVLMATGNTPLMDFDIFTGMRTLSANLAVELPEAPFHSTLYRTLFFGALVLFVMTFGVNSVAESMRHRIQKKFKAL